MKPWGTAIKRHAKGFCIGLGLSIALAAAPATAGSQADSPQGRIALLPTAQLKEATVRVDPQLHRKLRQELTRKGYEVVPAEQVMAALSDLHIRLRGEISTFACRQLGRRLQTPSLLTVTVTEKSGANDPVLGLLLQLYATANGQPQWGRTMAWRSSERLRLLGLNEAQTLPQLQQRMLAQILNELPASRQRASNRLHQAPLQIETVRLTPNHVQSGRQVQCRVKIHLGGQQPYALRLKLGAQQALLTRAPNKHIYTANIRAPETGGQHDLQLEALWNKEQTRITQHYLDSLQVYNQPPRVRVALKNPRLIKQGQKVFAQKVVAYPRIKDHRPVANWSITIKDQQGEIVVHEKKYSDLPRKLEWHGVNSRHRPLASGRYCIEFEVVDKAGLTNSFQECVLLKQEKGLKAALETVAEPGKQALRLRSPQKGPVGITKWSAYLTTSSGNTISYQGTELPADIPLPEGADPEDISCELHLVDQTGNSQWLETTPQRANIADNKDEKQKNDQFAWNIDF